MSLIERLTQQESNGDIISERLKGAVTRILSQSPQVYKPGFSVSKPGHPRASIFGTTSGKLIVSLATTLFPAIHWWAANPRHVLACAVPLY